jgi:hypothetical protein
VGPRPRGTPRNRRSTPTATVPSLTGRRGRSGRRRASTGRIRGERGRDGAPALAANQWCVDPAPAGRAADYITTIVINLVRARPRGEGKGACSRYDTTVVLPTVRPGRTRRRPDGTTDCSNTVARRRPVVRGAARLPRSRSVEPVERARLTVFAPRDRSTNRDHRGDPPPSDAAHAPPEQAVRSAGNANPPDVPFTSAKRSRNTYGYSADRPHRNTPSDPSAVTDARDSDGTLPGKSLFPNVERSRRAVACRTDTSRPALTVPVGRRVPSGNAPHRRSTVPRTGQELRG